MIDAREERDAETADVVGAYLLVNMNDYVVVKITSKEVDVMCRVSEEYKKYVCFKNGKGYYTYG